jgi:hypothetical protein
MEKNFMAASAATMVLIEFLKKFNLKVDKAYTPIFSVAIAAIVNTFLSLASVGFDFGQVDLMSLLVSGMAAGLTASGGYDSITAILKKKLEG